MAHCKLSSNVSVETEVLFYTLITNIEQSITELLQG